MIYSNQRGLLVYHCLDSLECNDRLKIAPISSNQRGLKVDILVLSFK